MELSNVFFPKSSVYRTGGNLEPINFFVDTLPNANQFDFLLGYFSSSAIYTLSFSFAKFIYNGGKVRLIINNILSSNDKKILEGDYDNHSFSLLDFKSFNKALNEYDTHFFECIAWLIKEKRIEIVVIKPSNQRGISHYKSGIIGDGENKIKFKASCNFTATALLENLEELDIRKSWISKEDKYVVEEQERYFDDIFYRKADFVKYLDSTKIKEAIFEKFGKKDIHELIEDEHKIIQTTKKHREHNTRLKDTLENLEIELHKIINEPKFPYSSGARDYQKQAYENWVNNDKKGVFAMATGTGKTLTALNCLLQEYNESGVYQAVILVPTNTLVKQWEQEVFKFKFTNVYKVSSTFPTWKAELSTLRTKLVLGQTNPNFIIITTYSSFYRDAFQFFFKSLPKETLLIADEAHNMAAPRMLSSFEKIHLLKRIALSATPKRIYDLEGSKVMEDFFSDKEPYTYSFSMERAINEQVLCSYQYHVHVVELTNKELKNYVEISEKLVKFFDFETGIFSNPQIATQLLMQRKRIIHKAVNKIETFKNIIKSEFEKRKNSLKYTFVYVPEGYRKDEENEDDWQENNSENHIINEYKQAIYDTLNNEVTVCPFLGKTANKEAILQFFSAGKIDVLTSMKCLDEGVDVPRTELAIFCASTGNPRQFIQRRGRVLRQHQDKDFAVIHDMIVVPNSYSFYLEQGTFNMEKSLVKKELERVVHFAFMSRNPYETIHKLERVCEQYDLNIHTIHQDLICN